MKTKSYNYLKNQYERIQDNILDRWSDNGNLLSIRRLETVTEIFKRYVHNIADYFGTDYNSPETKKSKERHVKLQARIYAKL